MRKSITKLIQILDGTPTVYGDRRVGQSLVELALVMPLLLILLMGLVEIGWFGSNFLSLMEVARVGARFGTVQQGEFSPLNWNNNLSVMSTVDNPNSGPRSSEARDCNTVATDESIQGFYNLLACVMLRSIDPLEFRTDNDVDDIVISAFALQSLDPTNIPNIIWTENAVKSRLLPINGVANTNLPAVRVVGRYPTNANECNYDEDGNIAVLERDPFDYITNNGADYDLKELGLGDFLDNRLYVELAGFDQAATEPEKQRGFVWAGQHTISGTNGQCYGSEFSIAEIEELMNLPSFSLLVADPSQRQRLPSQGMVLVEVFWQHDLLLRDRSIFNPVMNILGEQTTIIVWAAFPVPAVEPRIRFE